MPLHAKYVALQDQLDRNAFRRPLYLESSESPGLVKGDIYAVMAAPFAQAGSVLGTARDWCQVLMLHINTKDCRVSRKPSGTQLSLWVGTKDDQPPEEASRLDFAYSTPVNTPRYLNVKLRADDGPMGTRDYRIELEAIPLPGGRTFLRLSYSYGYGLFGRLAMEAYLATAGRNKVGFTEIAGQAGEPPRLVGGVRGVIERNTMRYYLAIDVSLAALSTAPQARFEKRIRDWFTAAEAYPRQLHEMELEPYLEMKRKEIVRLPVDPGG